MTSGPTESIIIKNLHPVNVNDYFQTNLVMEHFNICRNDIYKALTKALEFGADYADIYFEHTTSNSIRLTDNSVDNAGCMTEYGAGIRAIAGDHTGYAFTENITPEELTAAAKAAAHIAQSARQYEPVNLNALTIESNRYPVRKPWDEIDISRKRPFLERLNDKIFSLDSRVQKVTASHNDSTSIILFANSLGDLYSDYIPSGSLSAVCLMENNGRREQASSSRSFRMGATFLNDAMIDEMAHEVVNRTSMLFKAVRPRGGMMPVVMGAGGSGILLHEAIGHAFEADFNRKHTSILSDKLGRVICNRKINVVDDGTIPFNRGSINFDDEGVAGQKTYIVKEGRLNSYLHDRISARYYGVAPTGNGRRESFRCPPMPRMRATYMEAGEYTKEEIIASVRKGVYVDVFSNGQVQIGAGDFTFFVKSGYMIEEGRLTRPIKDINIIGNGPKALAGITMVGNDLEIDNGTWTCGKDGQNCPVTCGMPSVLVKHLTVGGN